MTLFTIFPSPTQEFALMGRMILALVAVLALAACTEQPPEITMQEQVPADQRTEAPAEGAEEPAEGGGAGDSTFVAVDIDFESAPETLPAGEVEITLVNNGAAVHNVNIDDNVIVEAQGGQTATGTVNLEPGTHEYHCSVPGHEALMQGEITVE